MSSAHRVLTAVGTNEPVAVIAPDGRWFTVIATDGPPPAGGRVVMSPTAAEELARLREHIARIEARLDAHEAAPLVIRCPCCGRRSAPPAA